MILIANKKYGSADIRFDTERCWWPTRLKVNDPFNTNLTFDILVGDITEEQKHIFFGVKYKGKGYILGDWPNIEPNTRLQGIHWADKIPTIGDFIKSLGGEITETGTIDLTWTCGYITNVQDNTADVVETDSIDTSIFVEVPTIDWMKIALIGGVSIAALGFVFAGRK